MSLPSDPQDEKHSQSNTDMRLGLVESACISRHLPRDEVSRGTSTAGMALTDDMSVVNVVSIGTFPVFQQRDEGRNQLLNM